MINWYCHQPLDNAMFTYSVIIPHKNCVPLLQRCLNSIPQRDDVQVVVVDDVSDLTESEKSLMESFGNNRTQVVFLTQTKYAGGARNVGLSLAEGQWVVFADSDDFFTKEAFDIFDDYKDTDCDIVFFGHSACYSDDLKPTTRLGDRTKYLEEFVKTHSKPSEKYLRYRNPSPTSKMIRNTFIKEKNLKFEEIKASNDSMFSLLSGYYANAIAGDIRIVYCSTIRRGSLTQTKNRETAYCRYSETVREYVFFREHGLEDMYPWVTSAVFHSLKDFGFKEFKRYLKLAREHRVNIWLGITRRFKS